MLIEQLQNAFTSIELKDMDGGEALLTINVAGATVPVHITLSYAAVGGVGRTVIVERSCDRIAEEVLDQALF